MVATPGANGCQLAEEDALEGVGYGEEEVALLLRVEQAEELDCPSWRAELETFTLLQRAIRNKRQADVSALMKRLEDLIERGATAGQVSHDLVVHVDKRAARANRMSELQLRREEKLTVAEVAGASAVPGRAGTVSLVSQLRKVTEGRSALG